MKMPKTPELPKNGATFKQAMEAACYTADQMREYALAYGNAVREECAKIAEDMDYGLGEIAAAIRKD